MLLKPALVRGGRFLSGNWITHWASGNETLTTNGGGAVIAPPGMQLIAIIKTLTEIALGWDISGGKYTRRWNISGF